MNKVARLLVSFVSRMAYDDFGLNTPGEPEVSLELGTSLKTERETAMANWFGLLKSRARSFHGTVVEWKPGSPISILRIKFPSTVDRKKFIDKVRNLSVIRKVVFPEQVPSKKSRPPRTKDVVKRPTAIRDTLRQMASENAQIRDELEEKLDILASKYDIHPDAVAQLSKAYNSITSPDERRKRSHTRREAKRKPMKKFWGKKP